jgi:hypothetical protein
MTDHTCCAIGDTVGEIRYERLLERCLHIDEQIKILTDRKHIMVSEMIAIRKDTMKEFIYRYIGRIVWR